VSTAGRSARVAVLGGGISGCVLAAELARAPDLHVELFERSQRLGGLHRSVPMGPYVFDIGAFIFEDDHSIFSVFPEVQHLFPIVASRYGSIRETGFLDEYPCTVGGIRKEFGTPFVARTVLEILASKALRFPRNTLRSYVEYYLGASLYRASGLQRYIERLYLARDTEIDVEFARRRMEALADSAGLRANLSRLARDLVHGRWPSEFARPRTASRVRVRPKDGFVTVYDAIADILRERGVSVRTGIALDRIEATNGRFRLREAGDPDGKSAAAAAHTESFDHVFATIPLVTVARLMNVEAAGPESMDLYSLFYECPAEPAFPYTVLHNFTMSGQWKRITVLSRYYGPAGGKHYLTVEGTLKPGVHDAPPAEGIEDFERWLRGARLFAAHPRYLGGVVTPHAYPVYRTEAVEAVHRLKQTIRAAGLVLAGRQGEFNYLTSSDAAGNARRVARQFVEGLA